MRCKVYYMSQRGSAEAVAEAVASQAGCPVEPLLPAYMPENVDLMFLGCEGARADKVTLTFIESLSPARVRSAALFQCAQAKGEAAAQMRSALEARGITVLEKTFFAPLRNLFGGSGPKAQHLEAARAFARDAIDSVRRA
jgi:hypothetical protein